MALFAPALASGIALGGGIRLYSQLSSNVAQVVNAATTIVGSLI